MQNTKILTEEMVIPIKNLVEYLNLNKDNISCLMEQLTDQRITKAEVEAKLPHAFKSMHEFLTKILTENKLLKTEEEQIGPRIEVVF